MLTDKELAEARADYENTFLTQRARRLKHSDEQNDSGGMVETFTPVGPITPCRISVPRSRGESVIGEQVQATAETVIELPVGTVIDETDKIAVVEQKQEKRMRDGLLMGAQIWSVIGPPSEGMAEAMVLSVPVVRID